jgi:hypothetical protein
MTWKNYGSNLKNLKTKGLTDMKGLKNKLTPIKKPGKL